MSAYYPTDPQYSIGRTATKRLVRLVDDQAEAISLAEIKAQTRVTWDEEDALLTALVTAARQYTEKRIGRLVRRQTWELRLQSFPGREFIAIPRPPLVAVDRVSYKNRTGDEQVILNALASPEVATSLFTVETGVEPGMLVLNPSESWPSDSLYEGFPVVIRFQAGIESPEQDLVQAMLLLAAHWYQHREAVVIGTLGQMNAISSGTVPLAYEALVDHYIFYQDEGLILYEDEWPERDRW